MKLLLAIPIALLEIVFTIIEIITGTARGLMARSRVWFLRDYDYRRWLKRDLADCETILELGCGSNSPLLQIGDSKRTDTVDIWQPYIDMHNKRGDYHGCWQADILKMGFPEKQYDAVVICDVMEHLDKAEVYKQGLFFNMEACAKKKVIIFAPNGFVENDLVDGDPHQAHVSAWEPRDYQQRGYSVVGATGFRWLFGKASLPKYRPYRMCAIIGMLSKPIVFHKPEWAWHSYAVKEC